MNLETRYSSRYRLQKKLGQGGMGVVYQATDRLTGDIVALKQVGKLSQQMIASGISEESLHLSLAHEFQILAGLRHPHIISVLDYGFDVTNANDIERDADTEIQPFYTMTYLPDAQTILDAAQKQPFAHQLELIQQLLQALAYLHRRGVLHRDIKPANVLVHEGTVRVLDFGLAVTDEERGGGSSVGTPLYMASELFHGEPYSPQADLFSVGVLATQMLTGKHPFAPFDFEFLDRVLDEEPNLGAMDKRLHPLVAQLLTKTADARFESANAALLALTAAFDTSQLAVVETTAIRESYLQAATFVGRETEMAQLRQALEAAQGGLGSAWLIGGESGVGKSRFVREVRTQALVAGFLVLMGQVEETQGGVYSLWREPLRHLLLAAPEVTNLDASVLLSIVPDIGQLLGRAVTPAPPLSGDAAQIRLFSTIASLFAQVQQPILLIIEDLHWAEESMLVLPYLTRLIGGQSMVLMATYRDDEGPQLPAQLPGMQPLHLDRLTDDNMAALSVAMLGKMGAQGNILQLLQRETEGNAFFAVEVIRTLAEDIGGLQQIGQMNLPDTLLPNGIQTIVERRFAQVGEEDRLLLLLAAVSGRVLNLAVITRLNEDHAISRWLTHCEDAAILEVVDDRWQFRHAKLRDGLLATLSPAETQRYHQQVAETIEQLYPNDANYAAQLMGHWRVAQHPEKEHHYAYLAGTHAMIQYANHDALTYLTNAYEVGIDIQIDPQKQVETLLLRESLYTLTGQSDRRKTDLALLTALAHQLNSPTHQSEVVLRQADLAMLLGDFPAVETFAQTAIPHAKAAQNVQHLVRAYLLIGESHFSRADYELAQNTLLQARMLAESIEDDRLVAKILISLADIGNKRIRVDHAIDYYKQALDIYQSLDNKQSLHSDEAPAYLYEGLEIDQHIGHQADQRKILFALARLYGYNNDWMGAEVFIQRVLTLEQQIGNRHGVGVALNGLGQVARYQWNYDKAYAYYLRALQINEEIGRKDGTTMTLLNLGTIYCHQQGIYEQAKRYLEQSVRIAHEIGKMETKGRSLVFMGNIFNRVGQYQAAQLFIEEGLATFRQAGIYRQEKAYLKYLGEGLLVEGKLAQAQDHFQQSLTMSQEAQDDYTSVDTLTKLGWVAYQRCDYTQMRTFYHELSTAAQGRNAPHYQAESQAGTALAHALATHQWAEVEIAPCIDYIKNEPNLLIPNSPFRLHLLCYHLLTLMEEPYAETLMHIAYEQLQDLASLIEEETWRESYLENVPEHREVVRLYAESTPET
ncbi:MAG: tetratricopeptide repeat protein [Chloroflexota bacterium]